MFGSKRQCDAGVARGRRGVTLVELLVVVVVLGILASMSIPTLDGARESAHFASVEQDLRNVGMAQELHFRDHLEYATDADDLVFERSPGVEVEVEDVSTAGWSATATHEALEEERGCVIHLGDVEAPSLPDGTAPDEGEGTIQCTE